MPEDSPKHGEVRNYRMESTFVATSPVTGHGMDVSVSERFCSKCGWVEERGVTGALRWMAEHGDHAPKA